MIWWWNIRGRPCQAFLTAQWPHTIVLRTNIIIAYLFSYTHKPIFQYKTNAHRYTQSLLLCLWSGPILSSHEGEGEISMTYHFIMILTFFFGEEIRLKNQKPKWKIVQIKQPAGCFIWAYHQPETTWFVKDKSNWFDWAHLVFPYFWIACAAKADCYLDLIFEKSEKVSQLLFT